MLRSFFIAFNFYFFKSFFSFPFCLKPLCLGFRRTSHPGVCWRRWAWRNMHSAVLWDCRYRLLDRTGSGIGHCWTNGFEWLCKRSEAFGINGNNSSKYLRNPNIDRPWTCVCVCVCLLCAFLLCLWQSVGKWVTVLFVAVSVCVLNFKEVHSADGEQQGRKSSYNQLQKPVKHSHSLASVSTLLIVELE